MNKWFNWKAFGRTPEALLIAKEERRAGGAAARLAKPKKAAVHKAVPIMPDEAAPEHGGNRQFGGSAISQSRKFYSEGEIMENLTCQKGVVFRRMERQTKHWLGNHSLTKGGKIRDKRWWLRYNKPGAPTIRKMSA